MNAAELRAAAQAEDVRRQVEGWPPLTAEQRTKLAGLLAIDPRSTA